MASIFCSKLFITSSRQDKIRAAIANPVNKELVQQLASYVDFDDEEEPLVDKSEKIVSDPTPDSEPAPAPQPEPDVEPKPEVDPEDISNDLGTIKRNPNYRPDTSDEDPEADPDEDPDEDPELAASTIIGSTEVEPAQPDPIEASELPQVVKGQLNADTHSKGVTRAAFKNTNELWVYFNDETNLNDILTAVLENLNAAGFGCLQFNRFARSDNAIVFTIDVNDSDNRVKFNMEVNNEDFPGIEEMQKRKTEVIIK